MGRYSQLKRFITILVLGPVLAFIIWYGLTCFVDYAINQKRVGSTNFYLIIQEPWVDVELVRKKSVLSQDYYPVSVGDIRFVYWDQSTLTFTRHYGKNREKHEYVIIPYGRQIDDLDIIRFQDESKYMRSCDSLGLDKTIMNRVEW